MKAITTLMLATALTFGATAALAKDDHKGGSPHHQGKHHDGGDRQRDFHDDGHRRGHFRHFWHGRWWYEGHGPCWRRTRVGWVWVCGDDNDNGNDNDDEDDDD